MRLKENGIPPGLEYVIKPRPRPSSNTFTGPNLDHDDDDHDRDGTPPPMSDAPYTFGEAVLTKGRRDAAFTLTRGPGDADNAVWGWAYDLLFNAHLHAQYHLDWFRCQVAANASTGVKHFALLDAIEAVQSSDGTILLLVTESPGASLEEVAHMPVSEAEQEVANRAALLPVRSSPPNASPTYTRDRILQLLPPVLSALDHVHVCGFTHCGVHTANVFIMPNGEVKLGPIDIALQLHDLGQHTMRTASIVNQIAPEQWRQDPVSGATDMWGVGHMLLRLMTWDEPVKITTARGALEAALGGNDGDTGDNNNANTFSRLEKLYGDDLVSLCKQLMQVSPDARPTALDVLASPLMFPSAVDAFEAATVKRMSAASSNPMRMAAQFQETRRRIAELRERNNAVGTARPTHAPPYPIECQVDQYSSQGVWKKRLLRLHEGVITVRPAAPANGPAVVVPTARDSDESDPILKVKTLGVRHIRAAVVAGPEETGGMEGAMKWFFIDSAVVMVFAIPAASGQTPQMWIEAIRLHKTAAA